MVQKVTAVVESDVWFLFPAWIQDTSSHLPPICLDREHVNFQASCETSITYNEQACYNPIAQMIEQARRRKIGRGANMNI